MILQVPMDTAFYPTLGPQVCAFMEQNLVFGPGDLRGHPLKLDEERTFLIYRMYEVYPKGHALAGRRRFQRVGISLAKGRAKTELSALVGACELHPEAPVRFDGWTKGGEPIGAPVKDPYIPFVAYTQEQSDELAYGALRVILEEGPLRTDFDIGLDKIERVKGDGKAVSLSAEPSARDGARTTFSVMDETHRMVLLRSKQAHQTMLNNLPKRKLAQPWMLEVTTAPEPGAGSVAESTMEYALAVSEGRIKDSSLFFFHMQASDHHDMSTEDGVRAAVLEASGDSAGWRDIDAIVSLWRDPTTDRAYFERVWCNRLVQGTTQAFDVELFKTLKREENPVKPGDLITLGFDGGRFHDGTGLVATHMLTGYQWVPGVWECPPGADKREPRWEVPKTEVDTLVDLLFSTYNVWRMYADPPYWEETIAAWAGKYGKDRVIEWFTNRPRQMSAAIQNYINSMVGEQPAISHSGDERLIRHIANSRKHDLNWKDEKGQPLFYIRKERTDSPKKMDLAMCSVLSWEARTDGLTAGVINKKAPEYKLIIVGGRR